MLQVYEEPAVRAMKALRRSAIREIRAVTVEDDGDAVVLQGRVSSFYHKQLAQEVVRNAVNGSEVVNHLHVSNHLPHGM